MSLSLCSLSLSVKRGLAVLSLERLDRLDSCDDLCRSSQRIEDDEDESQDGNNTHHSSGQTHFNFTHCVQICKCEVSITYVW